MIFLILDFESKDPYIDLGLGAGWPFAIYYPYASLFFPIGYSYCIYNSETDTISKSGYVSLGTKGLITNTKDPMGLNGLCILKDLIKDTKNIVMHNAQYDLGCLLSIGISIDHLNVYDTKIMAKLYDSALYSYSLSFLLKKYKLGTKATGSLADIVRKFDLLKTPTGKAVNQATKTYEERATKFAYNNMPLLQELDFNTMAYYAGHDTQGTALLFKFLWPKVGLKLSHFYSNIQKLCTKLRTKGIKVDLAACDKAIDTLTPEVDRLEQSLFKRFGGELNLHSPSQLVDHMLRLGYVLPKNERGNLSVDKEFLEENPNDPLCQELSKYRSLSILKNNFCVKIKDMQKYSCPDVQGGSIYGRIFPELNLLEARTGRFSSSSPSIQQIPKRDKVYAKLCRALFIPDNQDNNWYSLDWSNQEGRLQLHYAVLKDLKKAKAWQKRFIENPRIDTHSLVAEMMGGVDRNIAKTIYLGKSFCMGRAKTAKRLGLPVAKTLNWEGNIMLTSGPEATALIEKYEEAFPYLTELQKECTEVIIDRGYIITLGGRKCKRPPFVNGRRFDYKAISLLIQGSAADQMYKAYTLADEAGLNIKCIVHDEFNIEGNNKDAKIMKEIMETCVNLEVPSVAEVSVGKSWGSLEKLKGEDL